jgi:hypothetical protein
MEFLSIVHEQLRLANLRNTGRIAETHEIPQPDTQACLYGV